MKNPVIFFPGEAFHCAVGRLQGEDGADKTHTKTSGTGEANPMSSCYSDFHPFFAFHLYLFDT